MKGNGSPVGNVKMGRRFTIEERIRIEQGAPDTLNSIIEENPGPKLLTREEMYVNLFAKES